jgi:tetratricopeptide (TPR) repeat protein
MGKPKFKLTKKQLVTGASVAGVLVLAVGAGFIWQMLTRTDSPSQQGPVDTTPDYVNEIQDLRAQGDAQAVEKKINEQLNSGTATDDTKYALYIQQGNAATDKKDFNAAIQSYTKAEAIKVTYEITSLLANTYRDAGNKEKAIEYYKKAIPLIPDTPLKDDDKESIETKIRNLGGQP